MTNIDQELTKEDSARKLAPLRTARARAVPNDLRARRFADGYVVAACSTSEQAEQAVALLNEAGFDMAELVLVSEEVDTLRPGHLDQAVEVRNPMRRAKASGGVAGGISGAAMGASLALAVAYVAGASTGTFWLPVLAGGAFGAAVGALGGKALVARLRRAPAEMYDDHFQSTEIMVGAGIADDHPDEKRRRARAALIKAGLYPSLLRGEAA